MTKTIIRTENAPGAVGPYSQGIIANGFVFTAGQLGLDPSTKAFPEGGIEAQTRQALENLKGVLEAGGASLETAVKVTVFLDNIEDFAAMNGIYAEYFTGNPPARSAFEVARLPLGALVEIEAIATLKG